MAFLRTLLFGMAAVFFADDRMALLSILVLCIGNILVWISSSTPASSYSPTPTSSYLPTPVKKRAPKAFRKLFPGYKRSKWKKIALFLSCLGVSATASGYGTLAISVSSSGAADSGSASNAVGALLTAAAIGRGGAGEEKCTVEWCENELNKIRNEHNEHVIAYIIEVILPQVKAGVKLIPIFIGLCPTPERRGHESLGGKGRRDATRKKTALSIRLLQALNCCLPSCMDGGFDSKNPDIPNVFWVNARETCTDNGDTCKVCKSWTRVLANSIGAALCILSKCVKHYGGRTVAANVAGVSVKAHYIFEYLQAHGSFDGLSDSGTHISKLGCKCRAWTTAHQCDIASSTLASIDAAFKPTFEYIKFTPSSTFLQLGLDNPLFRYVNSDGVATTTCVEKCAVCSVADATCVDMERIESLNVKESSFNEGQDDGDEDDGDHGDDNDGVNIASCFMCRGCAQQATDDEDDDSSQFMTIVKFRQEEERAERRSRYAAKKEKDEAEYISVNGQEAWDAREASRLETRRKRRAATRANKSEEEREKDRDYHRKYNAARYVRDKARKKAKLDEAAEKGSRAAEKIEEGNQPAPANDDLDDLSLTQKTTLAPKPAKEKATKKATKKAKKKATKNPNWKADETILQCKLKRVVGTKERTHTVWNKLDGHARETMNIENFPSHVTFGKWWDGLNERPSPLTSIAIEVIESFCKVA